MGSLYWNLKRGSDGDKMTDLKPAYEEGASIGLNYERLSKNRKESRKNISLTLHEALRYSFFS